jgi:hypothetical protein
MTEAQTTSKILLLLISGVLIGCSTMTLGECAEGSKKKGEKAGRERVESKNRKEEKSGWLVSQNTPVNPYASSQTATIYGGIADVRGGPFQIIVDAGNETITFVSHKARLYFQGPFDDWKKRYYPESIKTGRKVLVDGKATRKMFGITAHQSFFSQKEPDGSLHKLREVWWTEDIKIDGVGCEYVWICSGLPTHHGLPLSITRMLPNGKKDPILTTVDVKKSSTVLSSFKPLPDYKKVKSEFELQVGKNEDLNELLGGE